MDDEQFAGAVRASTLEGAFEAIDSFLSFLGATNHVRAGEG